MENALKAVGCADPQFHMGAQAAGRNSAAQQLTAPGIDASRHTKPRAYAYRVGWRADLPASLKSFLFVVLCCLTLFEGGKDKLVTEERKASRPLVRKGRNSERRRVEGQGESVSLTYD